MLKKTFMSYLVTCLSPIVNDIKEPIVETMASLYELKRLNPSEEIIYVSIGKTNKDIRTIERIFARVGLGKLPFTATVSLGLQIKDYFDRYSKSEEFTWGKFAEHVSNCLEKELLAKKIDIASITDFFVYGGTINQRMKRYPKLNNINKKLFSSSTGSNFNQTRQDMSRCLYVYNFCHKNSIKVSQFHLDPEEICIGMSDVFSPPISYKSFFFYDYDKYTFGPPNNRGDGFIYYQLKYLDSQKEKLNKKRNFVLGVTYFTPSREYLIEDIKEIEEKILSIKPENLEPSLLFFKQTFEKKVNNYCKRQKYLKYLEESKYTLIYPSYHKDHFSFQRFIEAIARDCLPFIHTSANWTLLYQFGLQENWIKTNLVVSSIEELKNKIITITDSERIEILKVLQSNLLKYEKDMWIV